MDKKKTFETVSVELAKEIVSKICDLGNTSFDLKPCCGIFADGYTYEGDYQVHICKCYYPNDENTINKYPHGYIEFFENSNPILQIYMYKSQMFKYKDGEVVFVD